ncbi:hypothetical protein ACG74X_01360 [Marivita sp. S0852]|uniref:hypothetical protein n=1 Tax=Marivita sp. S0852 TaxID=3373893 RepID=UPI003982AD9B
MERSVVNGLIRRILLSFAALSPGVVAVFFQELALSLAFALLGVAGAISVAAVAIATSPKISDALTAPATAKRDYASLLRPYAFAELHESCPDPILIRAHLKDMTSPADASPGFVDKDQQIAMITAQIMARWDVIDVFSLSDDQARELWLVETLLRASPAEAGALAERFVTPEVMLTMRDRISITPVV